jgi:hypothetical protein
MSYFKHALLCRAIITGANAASGAVELTSNEAPSDEEGGLGAVPRRH